MKYLKLYESWLSKKIDNYKIHNICKNYTINKDGSVDVKGIVNLCEKDLTKLPLKFNTVMDHQVTYVYSIGSMNLTKNQIMISSVYVTRTHLIFFMREKSHQKTRYMYLKRDSNSHINQDSRALTHHVYQLHHLGIDY